MPAAWSISPTSSSSGGSDVRGTQLRHRHQRSYFLFTITDGAHPHAGAAAFLQLGYTPFMLAFLFLLYETAGIFANARRRMAGDRASAFRACWRRG